MQYSQICNLELQICHFPTPLKTPMAETDIKFLTEFPSSKSLYPSITHSQSCHPSHTLTSYSHNPTSHILPQTLHLTHPPSNTSPHTPSLNPPPTSHSPTPLPLAILCLSKLVNNKQQNQLLAARGVGEGVCLWVVSSVRGTLKCKDMVLDDRDVLIIIEGAVKPIRCEITEDQMMPVWR